MELIVLEKKNSILNNLMRDLRDVGRQRDSYRFRKSLSRIGEIMAYEISKTLNYKPAEVATPLGIKSMNLLEVQPVLITILRAGIPFYHGFLELFDSAESGFVAAERIETETPGGERPLVNTAYQALPDIENKSVILIDPMLATGTSLLQTIRLIHEKGRPSSINIASVIATPEGIAHIKQRSPEPLAIWTAALDNRLDENAFIVPGLGDAGDLSFGKRKK